MQGDDRLVVRFFKAATKHNFKSQEEGRPIYIDEDFIEILVPGDKLNAVTCPVTESHKARFPVQWAAYQNGREQSLLGTPVESWPALTPAQAATFSNNGFKTVEQLAAASDAQLASLGMAAGASPAVLRQKAAEFVGQETPEMAELKRQLAEMQAQLAGLMQPSHSLEPEGPSEPVRRGPGRPSKAELEARAAQEG